MFLGCAESNFVFFYFEDAPPSVRVIDAEKDSIKALMDANLCITKGEMREGLNWSNSTVYG